MDIRGRGDICVPLRPMAYDICLVTRPRQLASKRPHSNATPMAQEYQRVKHPELIDITISPTKQRMPEVGNFLTDSEFESPLGRISLLGFQLEEDIKAGYIPKRRRIPALRQVFFGIIIVVILSATGYVSYTSWRVSMMTEKSLEEGLAASGASGALSSHRQEDEGKDRTPLPANSLDNYKVGSDTPRAIYIDKINAKGRLLPMGVNRDSSMQAPINIYDGGWYTGASRPGTAGAVIINGHAMENNSGGGLFGKLYQLENGDKIVVEMGNGTKFSYTVVGMETVPLEGVDMDKAMLPYGDETRGLNLITCSGSWTKDGKTLDKRLIVYTLPSS